MTDPTPSPHLIPESTSATVTVVEPAKTDEQDHGQPTLKLRLKKPKTDRKVNWTTDTVDNEHMNKKKSKCCCIYEKPRKFGESSSDEEDSSDDECDHCKGHVDKKKGKHKDDQPTTSSTPDDAILSES